MKKSDFAIASLVMGIFSFIQLLGNEKALIAIVFGALALWRISKEPQTSGRWMAIAGIILGLVYLVLTVIFFPQIMQILKKLAG